MTLWKLLTIVQNSVMYVLNLIMRLDK